MIKFKKTIFLSGPMRGIVREEGIAWRNQATKLLGKKFTVKHAYRGREVKETFTDPRTAVARDKYDVVHSDLVLVNDTLPTASMIGTAMEVFLAFEKNIPVILFGKGHEKDYFLNYHSHARFDTLKEACAMINKMFAD
jgi:hypothetical protein